MEPSHDELYADSLEIHHQIEALYPRVAARRAHFRGLRRVSPRIPTPPGRRAVVDTDRVLCALAMKAAATKRAIVALCEAGHGENAFALTRVILENGLLMAWLTD